MNSREMVELAALIASHGALLIDSRGRLSESGLAEYWIASKCRLDRWGRALRSDSQTQQPWTDVQPVVEEVLTGEVLTRVWAAMAAAHDERCDQSHAQPIAHNIYLGHLEVRHRVLNLLSRGPIASTKQGRMLNHLRRRCERWTDLLIGHLLHDCDVSEFAFDRERAWDFYDSLEHQRRAGVDEPAWRLTLNSLRAAFRPLLHAQSSNADLNARIAASILCSLPPDVFDDSTVLRSLWMARLQHTHGDAERLIAQLLETAVPSSEPHLPGSRRVKTS